MKPEDFARQIEQFRTREKELETELSDPGVYAVPARASMLARERQRLQSIFAAYERWIAALESAKENRGLLESEHDPEFRSLVEADLAEQERVAEESEQSLLMLLAPQDRADSRDAIVEIKPAAGGEEAALFAGELFRMYLHYAEKRGWKAEVLEQSDSELGGVKGVMFSLSGEDIFSRMKYESGVHRVQRVPVTESGGRIHTSTVTVSVLPEASEIDDIVIRPEDLEVSTFRSSGPGGQNVNRTDSAVRIRHIPSGLVVASQQERSQIRNREIALRILKSRLLEIQRSEEAAKQAASKRLQVGTGDRSERIRTYNFPQNRVTDHRFGVVSVFNLPALMEGDLDMLLDPLFQAHSRLMVEDFLKNLESEP